MGGRLYLSTIILIHALVLLPCCSYGGRSNIKDDSFSSSNPIPFYVISSRLEVVVPDRVGSNRVSPSPPIRNAPRHFKSPPPKPPPPPPPPSPCLPEY